jgi:very-short-patch-repair endonuclease
MFEIPFLPADRRLSTADLRDLGLSERHIARLVRDGLLVRVRVGSYMRADSHPHAVQALRVGGRVACVSVLALRGVFVHGGAEDLAGERARVHVQLELNASRLGPRRDERGVLRLHWVPLRRGVHPRSASVDLFDALVQSAACQSPRAFIASVDSALHLGLLRPDDVDALFSALPRRFRRLRGLVDGRAESGSETLVRLMLRALGRRAELQVVIRGVGRVDLVVDGWLVIECDSKAFHSSWEQQREDRRRDQALAALGYVVYRPIAEDILYHPDAVVAALKGLLALPMRRRA